MANKIFVKMTSCITNIHWRMGAIFALITAVIFTTSPVAASEKPMVITTIKPLHGLISEVLGDLGTASYIVPENQSPHGMRLRPSHIAAMQKADAVIFIDPKFEQFMQNVLPILPGDVRKIVVTESAGIELLEYRTGVAWEGHDHHDHGDHGDHDAHHDDHAKHDDHDHGGHDDHKDHDHDAHHDDHAKHDDHDHGGHDDHKDHDHDAHHDDHAKHDDHDHGDHDDHKDHDHDAHAEHTDHDGHEGHDDHASRHDLHVWLDPQNAILMLQLFAEEFGALDPAHRASYQANASRAIAELQELDRAIRAELAPVKDRPYIVFHDAYQYLERAYGLNAVGSIALGHGEVSPGRISALRARVRGDGVRCVFHEPQFSPRLVETVIEGSDVKRGVMDPLGAGLAEGQGMYQALLQGLATSLRQCLQ